MTESKFDKGMKVRKQVLGEEHVERSWANATDFDRDFQEFITESAWGAWARPGLDIKTKHMIVIAVLTALGREKELTLHINASHNSGITPDEMRELLIQIAPYAGIPASLTAFGIAKKFYTEQSK
ncbi:MAG TPA: carboxymuconolactone decarboxylase family protein [Anaerolineales bacterium]